MITELIVKNFQIHEKRIIRLKPGLNVIIGDTDAGKSALIRALYLLIMNQPRSGEAVYKNRITEKPIDVQIKDDKGNVIRRHKKKYYLNGESLKAFGSDIPVPVTELFPFKNVNWQKQLDSHFLVLQTGGGAAKILNASTGMEDQEALMREIKSQISIHKSHVKRHISNSQEQQEIINELKPVTRLFMKAKAIKNIQSNSDRSALEINRLHDMINEITDCQIDPGVYIKVNQFLESIVEIESIQIKSNKLKGLVNSLNEICTLLTDVNQVIGKSEIYNMLIHSINSIESNQIESYKMEKAINHLQDMIFNLQNTVEIREHSEFQLEQLENEFSKKLLELGECPLCGTKFETDFSIIHKGHHIC